MDDAPSNSDESAPAPSPTVSYTTAPPRDRWAHRRTEPRPFALLWILYLLAAAVISFGSSGSVLQPSAEMYHYATHLLFLLAAIGIAVFWPMIRLSQAHPSSPQRSILMDLLVLLPPLHCIIWPQLADWMAQWSITLVASIAAGFTAWAFLIGALLCLALDRKSDSLNSVAVGRLPRADRRSLWMVAFLALAMVGPACALSWPGQSSFDLALLASPVTFATAILRHSHDLPGTLAHSPQILWSIAAPAGLAFFAWILLLLRSSTRPGQTPHNRNALAIPPGDA